MDQPDYYADRKFCPTCNAYVNYLMGMEHSYCVACGEKVRLFSKEDWEAFHENLSRGRNRGGRPKGNTRERHGKESA